MADTGTRFATRKEVDFVIVGSGSAGGIMAKELSTAGFDVVVLEQGPYRKAADFRHDELGYMIHRELMDGWPSRDPQSFRQDESQTAVVNRDGPPPAGYARTVGGSSVHFSGNFWRLRPVDFRERSLLGPMEGTGFADWPISYEELEPYYTKVDWEIGVSGAPGPFDAPRSKPYPLPPLPLKSSGAILEKGARALGLHPQVAPKAILSQPFNNRAACVHCGFCLGFGCEMGAKSSTLAAMIPLAEATGRCEIRPLSTVARLETNAAGRVSEVVYFDGEGRRQAQKAKAVVLCANGAESARLLLMSESARHPHGLGNSSGIVGKHLMWNCHSTAHGAFEHELHEYKSVQCSRIVHDFYESDPKRGFYGGGAIDARPLLNATPILYAMTGLPPDVPRWGSEFKKALAWHFTHNLTVACSTTSVPVARNNITLDPQLKDRYGRAAIRVTYRDHDDDLAMAGFLLEKAAQILDAAGAQKRWAWPLEPQKDGVHLLGTCRMGDDPRNSVVDRYHRSHEVKNLFVCDGSSMVSSGRGQPTMTIMALAFRAGHHIADFARRGEV